MTFAQRLIAILVACEPDIRTLIFVGVEKIYGGGFAFALRKQLAAADAAIEQKQGAAL